MSNQSRQDDAEVKHITSPLAPNHDNYTTDQLRAESAPEGQNSDNTTHNQSSNQSTSEPPSTEQQSNDLISEHTQQSFEQQYFRQQHFTQQHYGQQQFSQQPYGQQSFGQQTLQGQYYVPRPEGYSQPIYPPQPVITNNNAIASLILSYIGIIIPLIGAITAIIALFLAPLSMKQIKESQGTENGKALSILAIVISGLVLFFYAIYTVLIITSIILLS